MIPALNDIRREVGLSTVPTLTGRRRASRECRRLWRKAYADARLSALAGATTRYTMQAYADLKCCARGHFGAVLARAGAAGEDGASRV